MINLKFVFTVVVLTIAFMLAPGLAHSTEVQVVSYQTPLSIEELNFNLSHKELTVSGHLPNPCYAGPTASLTVDPRDAQVLNLHVSLATPMQDCYQTVEGVVATMHLPTLARTSQLAITKRAQYVIKSEGTALEVHVSGADLSF